MKFFLTASLPARAERRWRQLGGGRPRGEADLFRENLARVAAELAARDAADAARAAAPLRAAEDAIHIHTDHLEASDVLAHALEVVRARTHLR